VSNLTQGLRNDEAIPKYAIVSSLAPTLLMRVAAEALLFEKLALVAAGSMLSMLSPAEAKTGLSI